MWFIRKFAESVIDWELSKCSDHGVRNGISHNIPSGWLFLNYSVTSGTRFLSDSLIPSFSPYTQENIHSPILTCAETGKLVGGVPKEVVQVQVSQHCARLPGRGVRIWPK